MAFSLARLAPCPYCYAKIDAGKLWYRCSGSPAPGRTACTRKEDPARVRVLGDYEPMLPSFEPERKRGLFDARPLCPNCAGPTGTRVCPNCHSVIPGNFTASSPIFGIVGVRGSGKTVLLSVLGGELERGVARRFGASIDPVGDSPLLKRLKRNRDTMAEGNGELPPQTAASERVPAVYSLDLQKEGFAGIKQSVATIFSFYDTAGENLATADRARDLHYLEAASGIILLLDPFGFEAKRGEALQRGVDPDSLSDEPGTVLRALTEVLREGEHLKPGRKIKKPVAVVLAKIDAFFDEVGPDSPIRRPSSTEPVFDEDESLALHEYVASLVARWGGDNLLRTLEHNYETYRFFVASALGAEPNYSTKVVSSRGIQPHRVAEPLLWLMSLRSLVGVRKS